MNRHCQLKSLAIVDSWLKTLQRRLFPPYCLLCGDPSMLERNLCDGCFAALPRPERSCPRCAAALPTVLAADVVCGRCQHTPPTFDRAVAALTYEEPARYLIRALKFHRNLAAGRLLGELLAERAKTLTPLPQAILPVPLHSKRYRERGFNQAHELAIPIAHALGIPLLNHGVRRARATTPQPGLSAQQRRENLRGAFVVTRALAVEHVALVDDVMTTGATLDALAAALRQVGAQQIDVWVCARA